MKSPFFIPVCLLLLISLLLAYCTSTPTTFHNPNNQETLPDTQEITWEEEDEEEEDEFEKFLKQEIGKKTKEQQRKEHTAEYYYQKALNLFRSNEFEAAKEAAEKALELHPEFREARKLLQEICAILGEVPRRAPEEIRGLVEQVRARLQQISIEIRNSIFDAEKCYENEEYEEAIRHYNDARIKIKAVQPQMPKLAELLPDIEKKIKECKLKSEQKKKLMMEAKKREIEEDLKLLEMARKAEIRRTIAQMFETACLYFERRRYEQCISQCNAILRLAPNFSSAIELKADARKARRIDAQRTITLKKIEGWKKMEVENIASAIPYSEIIIPPSKKEWTDIIAIRKPAGLVEEEEEERKAIASITAKIESIRIDFDYEVNLYEFMKLISEITNIPVQLDPAIAAERLDEWDVPRKITFVDASIRTILKAYLSELELDYRVTPEQILITKPELAIRTVIGVYSLIDIVQPLIKFIPKDIPFLQASGEAMTPWEEVEEPEEEEAFAIEKIEELIKNNIAKETWEQEELYYLRYYEDPKLLIVKHTPEVQRQIQDLLDKIRMFRGLMITVQARFVCAYDHFLEDVGVDLLNQPAGAGFDFTGQAVTDINEWSGVLGPGIVSEEWMRGELVDIRAQTFHTFFARGPTGPVIRQGFNLSRRVSNWGGIAIQYAWLGEAQIQAVMRAVSKDEEASVVHTARATVSNGQNTYISWITQRAYIRDYDVTSGGYIVAYDPIIGYFHEGIVLTIKPVVSYDKKYVTLELIPSLVEFIDYRGGGLTQISEDPELWLQLPWIEAQQVNATIITPDRGTVVLAGFKDIFTRHLKSDVPVLGDIPIISFLFGRRAKATENRRLYILVTPYILDLPEIIKKFGD